ncbi:hypothetical protein ACFQ0P_12010 [Microbacterium insulae]|uniref:Uncharacterized protein n=1 Tax=Microbacterium insulae TaxID=483014 RepID=A0ABW3AJH2_9MICO
MARTIVAEVCPHCRSLDVRATEPRWFVVEFPRRGELDDGWVDRLEFACRTCGGTWD